MATISQTNQGLLSVREELTQEDANKSFDFSPILAELHILLKVERQRI